MRFQRADGLVMAVPVYFWQMNGLTQVFIDKMRWDSSSVGESTYGQYPRGRQNRCSKTGTLDIHDKLIPTMQSELAEMVDELVMPVTVQLEKKIAPGS